MTYLVFTHKAKSFGYIAIKTRPLIVLQITLPRGRNVGVVMWPAHLVDEYVEDDDNKDDTTDGEKLVHLDAWKVAPRHHTGITSAHQTPFLLVN